MAMDQDSVNRRLYEVEQFILQAEGVTNSNPERAATYAQMALARAIGALAAAITYATEHGGPTA